MNTVSSILNVLSKGKEGHSLPAWKWVIQKWCSRAPPAGIVSVMADIIKLKNHLHYSGELVNGHQLLERVLWCMRKHLPVKISWLNLRFKHHGVVVTRSRWHFLKFDHGIPRFDIRTLRIEVRLGHSLTFCCLPKCPPPWSHYAFSLSVQYVHKWRKSLLTTIKVHQCNNHFGRRHMFTLQGKRLSEDTETYGRQQDAVSPCETPAAADQPRDRKRREDRFKVICAYKGRHTYLRPYAYLTDLSDVRWHVTRSVATARQAWRAIGGGQEQKTFWK